MTDNETMFILAKQLSNLPVMSLQTGQSMAMTVRPLISMPNLETLALFCAQKRDSQRVVLMRDIRQFATDCIIVDSEDDLEDPAEIVRLSAALKAGFNPIGKLVVNESGVNLGRVDDFTINLDDFKVQKLYVQQSLMRSLLFNSLVIDRTQITDISPTRFTVRDAGVKQPLFSAKTLPESPK